MRLESTDNVNMDSPKCKFWLVNRQQHSTAAMPDGSIILTGGAATNDTWRSTDNGSTWNCQNVKF